MRNRKIKARVRRLPGNMSRDHYSKTARTASSSGGSELSKRASRPVPGWTKAREAAWRKWRPRRIMSDPRIDSGKSTKTPPAVGVVSHHRVPQVGQVDPDLVRPPGVGRHRQVGEARMPGEHPVTGQGGAGLAGPGRDPGSEPGMAPQGHDRSLPDSSPPSRKPAPGTASAPRGGRIGRRDDRASAPSWPPPAVPRSPCPAGGRFRAGRSLPGSAPPGG